ncbi:hypothetical protein XENOCAPTIV_005712 [Xenoophorus captivus]|uniref:PIH1 domain containing 2 n=1 Tax=Xenoophorus captivus TaxID=1517983 RepID=A0ABV0SEG9_9TELE
MSTTGGREDVLRQVSQFWSMLDDLSENDPATYRKFIEEQMKRGAEFNAPPELHSCLRTQILVISSTFQGPQVPEYLLEVKSDSAGVPRSMELTVELPKVCSMSECQLRVSKVSGYTLPSTLIMNCFDSTVLHCMAGYRIKYIIGLW